MCQTNFLAVCNFSALQTQAVLLGDRQAITTEATVTKIKAARHLQMVAASESARTALHKGKLESIGAQEYREAVYMRARLGKKDLARLLGVT